VRLSGAGGNIPRMEEPSMEEILADLQAKVAALEEQVERLELAVLPQEPDPEFGIA